MMHCAFSINFHRNYCWEFLACISLAYECTQKQSGYVIHAIKCSVFRVFLNKLIIIIVFKKLYCTQQYEINNRTVNDTSLL